MLGPTAVVDPVAAAKRIQRIRSHRVLAARQRQRIDHTLGGHRRQAEPLELGIDEAHVEAGIVGDEAGAVDEGDELVDNLGKSRLADELGVADPMNGQRIRVNRTALRIDVDMEGAAGGKAVVEFDAADFDHAVLARIKTGRFRIENYFAHANRLVSRRDDLPADDAAPQGGSAVRRGFPRRVRQ